jgi:hypothetical protein
MVAEARASGLLPHEMSLWHARDAFEWEQACRAAANERGISPERQAELLEEAQQLAEWCEACCKHSARFYAPIMHQVAGDKNNPLYAWPRGHRVEAARPTLPLGTIAGLSLAMLQICRVDEFSYCAPVRPRNRRMVDTNEQE